MNKETDFYVVEMAQNNNNDTTLIYDDRRASVPFNAKALKDLNRIQIEEINGLRKKINELEHRQAMLVNNINCVYAKETNVPKVVVNVLGSRDPNIIPHKEPQLRIKNHYGVRLIGDNIAVKQKKKNEAVFKK
ncbi:uncharacterized protein LOC126903489 isoform X2 [Daktulosphaira vitifoliae]|uniref:uncharacterized protein LOC126903489 isoform X2 n=1 Tax=Daktulosphaira vitifoliae TaxID=58002 RepID=UPI0021AA68B4|nr:uncharacterized protein LOC126903489 isoform X2 [Daktulosphaira vitifoliae]